jgi:hypothetical protein
MAAPHWWHILHSNQHHQHAPVDNVELRPQLSRQMAVHVREFFGMITPVSVQATLDDLVGLDLIAEELYPQRVPEFGAFQPAGHRFQNLLFPDVVIDPLPAKEFCSGHVHAKYKAPRGKDNERVERGPIRNGSRRC